MNNIKTINKLVKQANNIIKEGNNGRMFYSVREYAKISGIPKNTLRHYCNCGFIKILNVNGYDSIHIRYLDKLNIIRILSKEYGINLAGIRYILGILECIASDMPLTERIEMYAKQCGMHDDYKQSRIEIHERKYHKDSRDEC